jgi:tetratricopeptide (TPR) repeat protein
MATEERQQQVDRLFQLAVSSDRAKAWDLAEQRYRSVLELDSSHHEAWNNLGVVLYSVGKYSEAIESIDEALRLDPIVARYHYNLGKTLEELGKLAQAMNSYKKAIEVDVDFDQAKIDLARLLRVQTVTCLGEFMRGRHSVGILKMLGVTDTIANNESEYIQIAVRLGLDPSWRKEIVNQMQERHNLLYDDTDCIAGLESFYRQVVQEHLNS